MSKFPVLACQSTMNDEYQLNLRKLFERGVKLQPTNAVITKVDDGYHRITYKNIQIKAHKLASSLSKCGIKPGDKIGTFMYNNARHLIILYALPCMGAVINPINTKLHPNQIAYIIKHSNDRILFVDSTLMSLFVQIPIDCLKLISKIIICGDNQLSINNLTFDMNNIPQIIKDKLINYELFESYGSDIIYKYPILNDNSAMGLVYTSGTTGDFPKGVLRSHRATYLFVLYCMAVDSFGISKVDNLCSLIPFYHGLSWSFPFVCLALGSNMILMDKYRNNYADIVEIFIKESVSVAVCVPTIIKSIQKQLLSADYILATKLRIISSGSMTPLSLIKWFNNKYNIEVIPCFGMAESPIGFVSRNTANKIKNSDNIDHEGICGEISPCYEAKIIDDCGNEIRDCKNGSIIGELMVYSPYSTNKYYNLNENDVNNQKFDKHWYKTGDLATFTKNGDLVIKGRSKELIKSGGEWISPNDMESYLMKLKGIDVACVIGISHPKWDERPILIIQSQDRNLTKEQIMNHLKAKYSKFQLPDDVLFWDKIPLTGTNKVSKKMAKRILRKQSYVLPALRSKL